MRVLTSVQRASSVRAALGKAISSLNDQLAEIPGSITKMDADVGVGMAGATTRIAVVVDEAEIVPKCLLWANEPGGDDKIALARAEKKINTELKKLSGRVASFYMKFISPPVPRRTYATLIVAVNEELPEKIGRLAAPERRERLAAILRMLGNDSRAINLSRVAGLFGVSRDVIYKDLRKLELER